MSSKLPNSDVAIIGGGFSALCTLAHLVRRAEKGCSITVIAPEGFQTFGPAYSTPRDEHLLNVRCAQMGIFSEDPAHFHAWLSQSSSGKTDPDAFMPRRTYGRYLAAMLQNTLETAQKEGIDLRILRTEATAITPAREIVTDAGTLQARQIVIAAGNVFVPESAPRFIANPWHYNFAALPAGTQDIAIVGTGLTALDIIISLDHHGYKGRITCYSGNGHLPLPHPRLNEVDKTPVLPRSDFMGLRLSKLLHTLRRHVEHMPESAHWSYALNALRPFTQDIWQSLSTEDQQRAVRRYLWLWNMHRHRFDPKLGDVVDRMKAENRLTLRRGRVTASQEDADGITLDVTRGGQTQAWRHDLAFKCTGPSYRAEASPLLSQLISDGIVAGHASGFGIAADEDLCAASGIYALGASVFGQFFEITAVPDIRNAAAHIVKKVTGNLRDAA